MLTIIVMFLIAMFVYKRNRVCSYALSVLGILVVICLPLGGYHQAELIGQEELVPIVEADQTKYLDVSNKQVYVYRREDKENSGQGVLGAATGRNVSVEVVPLQNGESPRMCKYVTKPRCGLFTFAFWAEKTQYVFYVPEDTMVI